MPEEAPETLQPSVEAVRLITEVFRYGRKAASDGLNVVLLVDQFPPVLGGGERVVLRTASLLQAVGYQVSIVTFQIFCAPEILAGAQCPIYLLPVANVFGASGFAAAWTLGRFLRHERVDIVMTFFESANLFGGITTKALSKAKLIWNRRDMGILRAPKHRWAYRLLPWLPDCVIAVSEQVRQHAIKIDGISSDRVHVVYNGQDAGAFPLVEREYPPTVTAVGNLRPVKGQDVLIEAAALVLKELPDTKFQIIGEALDPGYDRMLTERVAELNLGNRILFLGGVPQPQFLLRKASVFVLPSRSEGFSNSIVEAMLAGLPVVATSVGGNPEAVLHSETGLLVAPESPDELANALLSLLRDPKRAEAMGQRGRARAEELFTSKAMLSRLERIFRDEVGRG